MGLFVGQSSEQASFTSEIVGLILTADPGLNKPLLPQLCSVIRQESYGGLLSEAFLEILRLDEVDLRQFNSQGPVVQKPVSLTLG